MRVTNNMMVKKYTKNLNNALSTLTELQNKVTSGRKFDKFSQDPINAMRSYNLERDYSNLSDYQNNINEASSMLASAESAVMDIHSVLQESMSADCLQAVNGTQGYEERVIIANKLRNVQKSILQTLNSRHGDTYVFGVTDTSKTPFSVDSNGELMYRGVNVNSGLTEDGKAVDLDALANEKFYTDIGLGLKFNADNTVNEQSALDISVNGLSFMGYGVDENGLPNSVYSIISEIADKLSSENYSYDEVQPLIEKLDSQNNSIVLSQITKLGVQTNYIDRIDQRFDNREYNLQLKIEDIEMCDKVEAITDMIMQNYAYRATLQMGSNILQASLLDYLN